MTRHIVCKASDVHVGKLTRAAIGRAPVVLMRLPNGDIRAFSGRCPHQGAALEYGCISGLTSGDTPNDVAYAHAGEILRCPWHGFEFSLVDGNPLIPGPNASAMRLRLFKTEIENDNLIVET